LSKLKRLSTVSDAIVELDSPFSMDEINQRNNDYPILSDKKFATKYSKSLFRPATFRINGIEHHIQYNFCDNPFCKWLGKPQERFTTVKNKPYRYKLVGEADNKSIQCNPDPIYPYRGMTFDCKSKTYSNWSIAQEIERLVRINSVRDIEPEYQFHKESCEYTDENPFEHPSLFYKRGKSKTGTQRWQCKKCGKRTDLMPTRRQTSTYNQKRNDILPLFTKLLVNKTPVSRAIDVLEIGVKTYYSKLEWVYRRCLEFLERHEQKPLQNKSFGTVWINTDKMIYNLNNVRKKGMGGARYDDVEDTQFPTHIIISADVFSRYVFRADVAFDWDVRLEDIMLDTILYKDDHLHLFARKHARLRLSSYPQEPTENDTQTMAEYKKKLGEFDTRSHYVEGLHTNGTYTSMAHYWLIKDLLKAQKWRFVTDNESSFHSAIYRVFSEDFRSFSAHHFLCLTDREKSRKQAYQEYREASTDLYNWGLAMGIDSRNPYTMPINIL
jgi:transposase-like protein